MHGIDDFEVSSCGGEILKGNIGLCLKRFLNKWIFSDRLSKVKRKLHYDTFYDIVWTVSLCVVYNDSWSRQQKRK